VLSFRNEEEVVPELLRRLTAALTPLEVDYELIFVNDASTDQSLSLLTEAAQRDARVKVLTTSRRFGNTECTLAGMAYAQGDAIVYMDTDLQDPPEVIPQLIERWRRGAGVVHTVRASREGESAAKLLLTRIAYKLIGCVSDIPLMTEAGDFKLLSRVAVDQILRLRESNPYLRGLACWVGFQQEHVVYHREKRAGGKGHFPIFRNFLRDLQGLRGPAGTLVQGLTSFSLLPLVFFLLLGFALCAGSLIALLTAAAAMLFASAAPTSAAILIIAVSLLAGIQLVALGTVGLYVGRIYNDVRGRPRYIVAETIGFGEIGDGGRLKGTDRKGGG